PMKSFPLIPLFLASLGCGRAPSTEVQPANPLDETKAKEERKVEDIFLGEGLSYPDSKIADSGHGKSAARQTCWTTDSLDKIRAFYRKALATNGRRLVRDREDLLEGYRREHDFLFSVRLKPGTNVVSIEVTLTFRFLTEEADALPAPIHCYP